MNTPRVIRHRKQTTHLIVDGHTIVARHAYTGPGFDVVEHTVHGAVLLHTDLPRVEADVLAAAYAATRTHLDH